MTITDPRRPINFVHDSVCDQINSSTIQLCYNIQFTEKQERIQNLNYFFKKLFNLHIKVLQGFNEILCSINLNFDHKGF